MNFFERTIAGRPTGYSAGENERQWKKVVAEAFTGCVLPADARVEVVMDFLLGPNQCGQNEPDLDNLIKSTVDALVGVIEARPGSSVPLQTNDVRISWIVASKSPASEHAKSGAHLIISQIPRWPG